MKMRLKMWGRYFISKKGSFFFSSIKLKEFELKKRFGFFCGVWIADKGLSLGKENRAICLFCGQKRDLLISVIVVCRKGEVIIRGGTEAKPWRLLVWLFRLFELGEVYKSLDFKSRK